MNMLKVLLAVAAPLSIFAQSVGFIHVDQFGYLNNAEKVAVISDPQFGFNGGDDFTPGATVDVVDQATNSIVFSGQALDWNNGLVHAESGDAGWWFDFSTVTTSGTYFISTNGEQSTPFKIGPDVYKDVLKHAGRMFYYNRCNHVKAPPYAEGGWTDGLDFTGPLQDENCRFINDPSNASLEKDLSGGWYDAGDYNKYVRFASGAVHDLLMAFEENPQAFGDDWSIPESGNGIPDILDEVKWELDWLLKMTNADGSVHIKMGSQNYSDNTSSPPSANIDQRFYGPTCTSASIAASHVFAQAATVYGQFPNMGAFTQALETSAEATYNYWISAFLSNGLETDCDDGSIVSGDTDMDIEDQLLRAVTAAVFLYRQTGDQTYSSFLQSIHLGLPQIDDESWGSYRSRSNDALLVYANLANANGITAASITNAAYNASTDNWSGYYGFNNTEDLYRSFMPVWSYHWGSNLYKANYANLNISIANSGANANKTNEMFQAGAEILHYFHGVNPLSICYLSNMNQLGATRSINEIYHTWFYHGTDFDNAQTSLHGPPPGYLVGGPNQHFSIASISPPASQPQMKSYLDFNTGWPDNSWEVSEPAIYYQASYLRLLANYVDITQSTSIEQTPERPGISVFPNPSNGNVGISGLSGTERIDVVDSKGAVIMQAKASGAFVSLNLESFGAGLFTICVTESNGERMSQHRVVLQ